MIIKKCKNCGNDFETKKSSKQHCSNKCFSEYRKRPEVLENTLRARKLSCIKKYGVDNAAKNQEIKDKAARTCIKKYGAVSPTLVNEIRNKQISTNLLKYGVSNPQQNMDIKQKQQNTLFKHYGVTSPLQSEEIKNKTKKTCINKYGTINPAMNSSIKEKQKSTNTLKYNSSCVMHNSTIREKMKKTRVKNHYTNVICNSNKFKNITPLFSINEYTGNVDYNKEYEFLCKICNNKFSDTLLSGNIPRCTVCYPAKSSIPQTEIYDFIKSVLPTTEIIINSRHIINPLELDIYIPDKKLAIEFNGLYWHSEISGKKNKTYHINKTNRCKQHGIRLIHIFEDEWINQTNIIKSKILHLLKLNTTTKIYARKCEVKPIDAKVCEEFLEKYHIQGNIKSNIRLGLFFKDSLVATMTFGPLRFVMGNKINHTGEYEMYRFCTSTTIAGAAGKLLQHFIRTHCPNKIVSYADSRFSNDSSFYEKLNFKCVSQTSPNYWYVDKNYNNRIYRYNFSKHNQIKKLKTFDAALTEWQNMQINGYDRIWDCGNLKYEWIKNDYRSIVCGSFSAGSA